MKPKFVFSFRESDDYEEKNYGFAKVFGDVEPTIVMQGSPLEGEWKEPLFRMEYGEYTDFIDNASGWFLCSSKLKGAIERNMGNVSNVLWLPADVQNDDEIREYYVCLLTSFLKMDDVVNKDKSRTLSNGEIYLPCFDSEKLVGKHIFSLEDFNNSIFISDTLKRILQQEEFTGLGFEDWKSI